MRCRRTESLQQIDVLMRWRRRQECSNIAALAFTPYSSQCRRICGREHLQRICPLNIGGDTVGAVVGGRRHHRNYWRSLNVLLLMAAAVRLRGEGDRAESADRAEV